MLVWLAEYLTPYLSIFNVVSYPDLPLPSCLSDTLGLSLWMGPHPDPAFTAFADGRIVRNDGAQLPF